MEDCNNELYTKTQKEMIETFSSYYHPKEEEIELIKAIDIDRLLVYKKDSSVWEYDELQNMYYRIVRNRFELMNEEDFKRIFKRRFQFFIYRLTYNVDTLSDFTGISTATLYRYLSGDSLPSYYHAYVLASALNIKPEDFLLF